MRGEILNDILNIEPFDDVEIEHKEDAIEWIRSGGQIFRTQKPATPPKHLVSYFVLVDGQHFLLVDHLKAGLWLPPGGHVDPNEHPRETAAREAQEELKIEPEFQWDEPQFITVTETVGRTPGHTDVSLWYVVRYARIQRIEFDRNEFRAIKWFHKDELPLGNCDPHLGRFVQKLSSRANFR